MSLKKGSTNRGGRALKSARLLLKSLAVLIPLLACGASHAESAPSEQYHGPGASPSSAKRALQAENPWIARAMQDDAFVIRQRLPYDRVDMPQANKPNQVGIGVELAGSERFINLIDLNWRQHPSGHYAAVIAYTLEQARALRIALSLEGFPKGLTVKFVDADPATPYPAASLGHAKASELLGRGLSVHWSPIIAGETLHIELNHPDILEAGFGDARIELPGMSYLYAEGPWGRTPAPGPAKSGALKADGAGVVVPKAAVDRGCAVDVSCPTPGIADAAKDFFSAATALILYTEGGSIFVCTGHLLADRDAATSKPYLLTANHCIGSQSVAATVVAYWDYRAPSCGGDIARRQSPTTQDSELLATSMQQDWTLLILGSERNPAVLPGRRVLLGWDSAAPSVGERLHHIGHSAAKPQSYASGRIASVGNTFVIDSDLRTNMLEVNWETGLTAGGSSGSVFVRLYEDGGIRARTGGLSGGSSDVCESLEGDGYGHSDSAAPFSLVFPHISRFLDGHGDTPPEVPVPDRHGGTRGGATILDAGSGGAEAAGDIAPGDDVDYFRFTVPAGPGAAVTAYTTGGLDTVGRLEDGAGARLAANDDAGDEFNFRMGATLPPGDYYVRVESYGGGTGAYRLHLEVMPDTDGRQPRLPRSAMADFDGGGAPDILLRNKGGAWWLYGLDGGRIVSSGPVRAVSNTRWAPQSLADFDGDGKADLLIRNLDTGAWWLYLMDGNAVAAQGRVAMTGDRAWRPEAFTDTNGDGAADVILRHADSGRWWRYGLSGASVIESGELEMARDQEYRALAFRDFNGDGRTDAVLRHRRSGRWLLYALDGDEAIGSALLANRDLAWVPQAFEDFNGDGRADLLLRNLEAGNWWLYTLNGNAIETAGPVRASRDFGWRPVAFADLDGNGVADMILRNDDGAWWTYLMDGGRVVGGGRLSANRDRNWRPVAVEDFDGDGRADLLLRNLEIGSWWLYRLNGNVIEASGPVGATRDRQWTLIE